MKHLVPKEKDLLQVQEKISGQAKKCVHLLKREKEFEHFLGAETIKII